ncbi:AsmA family protein [Xanthobacter sp. V3C-3]|uniref:AsmA family protein n=1 Tax=Xanthobacter lutulentifluminis TaxID=3119935 RepID=UPI0037274F3C
MVAIAVGVLAIISLTVVVVLPLVVPSAELRRTAVQALSGSTGQRVAILGEPSLRLFPSPRVVLGKVSFPLPAGQSLDAENVVTRLDIWSLLAGKVEVDDVIVEHPTLVLAGDGIAPALAVAPVLAAADRPELRIVDGTIVWRTAGGLTRELVSGLTASLDRVNDGRGVAIAVAFDWREDRVAATALVDDAAALMSGTPTPTRLMVSTTAARARFQGRAALGDAPVMEGTVSAEGESLRDLITWAGLELPTAGGFGPFALASRLSLDNGAVSLTEAAVELDGNRGDGAFLLQVAQGRPVLQGTFAADRLNLTPYGALRLTTDDGRAWDRRRIDLSWLSALDLDLRLSAGRVIADETTLSTVAASAVLSAGRLVIALGEAKGWGGALRASLSLAPAAPEPDALPDDAPGAEVRFEAEATDVDLARTLEEIAGMRRIEGVGSLQVDVAGAGHSVLDIARNVAGSISLSAANGYLAGFDVAQVLQRVERRPLSAVTDSRGGRTAFAEMACRIAIVDGVGTVEEMQLQGRQVRLNMAGSVAIGERTIDLSGKAALLPSGKGTGGVELPFSVHGPWDAPVVMADPLSLIERSGAALPLLEAVKGRTGGAAAEPILDGAPLPAAPRPAPAN